MKYTNLFILSIAVAGFLSGCAVENDKTELQGAGLTYQSEVKELENGNYYIEIEASPAAGRIAGATNTALSHASDYCLAMNKEMKKISVNSDDNRLIHINGIARVTFECN